MWVQKHGPTWRIRDRHGEKTVTVKSGYANKTVATKAMVLLKAAKLQGDALVHRGGELTLSEWIEIWWPSYEVTLKPSARVSAQGIIDRYITPMIGGLTLDELDPVVIQRWVANLLAGKTKVRQPKPLSRKTVANAHGALHKILGEAVGQRLIRTNPCGRTRLPQKTHHEMKFLTQPEAQRLIVATPEHWRPLILLLLGTGLRWGEAIGLRVKDVDVLAGRLQVRRNLQELANTAEMVEAEPKTAAGRRTVTFNKRTAEALVPLVVGKGSDEHVFLAPKGGMVRYRVFWPVWDKARKAAGLPGVRIHDLRHSHAAWLISSSIRGGLTAVQRRLGHSSYSITSDIYGHLLREADEDIMKTMDDNLPEIDFGRTVGAPMRTEENRNEPNSTQEHAVL